MKYQVLFSLKNNEKVFINVVCAVVIGALRLSELLHRRGKNVLSKLYHIEKSSAESKQC